MKRFLFSASVAALVLAACAPEPETTANPVEQAENAETETDAETAEIASTDTALPADLGNPTFEETADDYEIRTVVASEIAAFDAALAEKLMEEAKPKLEALKQDAIRDGQSAREQSEATGEPSWFRPYSLEYRYEVSAQDSDYISIVEKMFVDTGGAHPNHGLTGLVYKRGDTKPVEIKSVISNPEVYGARLKEHLVKEKQNRAYDDALRAEAVDTVEELLGDAHHAGTDKGGNFVFAPSTEAGKFGGITVLYSPYEVGPYAEGAYEITVPASELEGALTPEWAARFGGEPVLPAQEN